MSAPTRARRGAHPSAAIESWSRPSRRQRHVSGRAAAASRPSLLARLKSALRHR